MRVDSVWVMWGAERPTLPPLYLADLHTAIILVGLLFGFALCPRWSRFRHGLGQSHQSKLMLNTDKLGDKERWEPRRDRL